MKAVSFFLLSFYFSLFIFSYFWVDMNLTLTTWQPVNDLISRLQHFGYFNRQLSSKLYLIILLLVFGGQLYFFLSESFKKSSLKHLLVLAGLITIVATLSYPFLSHDIFSYLFNAKIIWHYHQNPYLKAPEEFPDDPWLRFTHWTEYTTPYGLVWIFYSLLPAIFSFGKFTLNFYGLKLLNGLLFYGAGVLLLKMSQGDRRVFIYWFFNPFLLIELLVNAHNDLLMIGLFFFSLFLLEEKKRIAGWLSFLGSIMTKRVTFVLSPFLFLERKRRTIFFNLVVVFLLIYFGLSIKRIHSWYFSWLFLMLPFARLKRPSWVLIFGLEAMILVLYYYPFILTGFWESMSFDLFLSGLLILSAVSFLAFQSGLLRSFDKIKLR